MSYELSCRIKPYIQPFERELALRELEELAGAVPRPVPSDSDQPECFRVRSQVAPAVLARDLAFWETVRGEDTFTTTQSLRESTVNVVRNGISLEAIASILPFNGSVPLPNRRCLRYGSHGLHEYRGKFFPQLVRNFMNLAKVPPRGVVADPFSGSGTTAVEAILAERTVVGLDTNPLSVFMAKTKCALLRVKVSDLEDAYVKVRSVLLASAHPSAALQLREIAPSDAEYLAAWFHPRILEELDFIYASICLTPTGGIRELFLLALSNILRKVSWQREDDLRVRREIKLIDEIDPIREFLEEIGRSVRMVLAFLRQEPNRRLGKASIEEGDARHLQTHWRSLRGKIDAVITSPPYATALPYLDTDRLSLCFLGLLPRNEHRKRDQAMIGNREISKRARTNYWNEFTTAKDSLPVSVTSLISRIQSLNQKGNVGFRRRNLASLLYKYFSDMRQVFVEVSEVLRDGASLFVVVGNNHTVAGGKHIEIPTADLLGEIIDSVGLQTVQRIPMEMLVSRDIFRKNAIASESILHFKKL